MKKESGFVEKYMQMVKNCLPCGGDKEKGNANFSLTNSLTNSSINGTIVLRNNIKADV